jgi:hypothetical protein
MAGFFTLAGHPAFSWPKSDTPHLVHAWLKSGREAVLVEHDGHACDPALLGKTSMDEFQFPQKLETIAPTKYYDWLRRVQELGEIAKKLLRLVEQKEVIPNAVTMIGEDAVINTFIDLYRQYRTEPVGAIPAVWYVRGGACSWNW